MDWISHIPSHWRLIRLNYILTESKLTSTAGTETLLAVSQYTDVTISERNIDDETYAANEFVGYKLVSRNDLVINIMLAWNGSLGVSMHNGIVSPSYCVYSFDEESYPQYYHYLLRAPMMLSQFMKYSSGIVISRLRLYPDDLHNILVPKPPLSDQVIIALYLDNFNTKLDYLTELRKNQIILLEEYKRAVIQQAVTRGLDPDVPLKPSGVEWLGDIPEHWEVHRLKTCVSNIITKEIGDYRGIRLALEHVEGWTGKYWDAGADFILDSDVKCFQLNDVLFGKLRPYLAKVARPDCHGTCVGEFLVLRPVNDLVSPEFLEYLLRSQHTIDAVNASTFGARMPRADWQFIGDMHHAFPLPAEQAAIVSHLDKLTYDIDAAIAHTRREIELLEEYRTRLIADVVTGKLDVREAAADLPDVNLDDLQPLAEDGEADD